MTNPKLVCPFDESEVFETEQERNRHTLEHQSKIQGENVHQGAMTAQVLGLHRLEAAFEITKISASSGKSVDEVMDILSEAMKGVIKNRLI